MGEIKRKRGPNPKSASKTAAAAAATTAEAADDEKFSAGSAEMIEPASDGGSGESVLRAHGAEFLASVADEEAIQQ